MYPAFIMASKQRKLSSYFNKNTDSPSAENPPNPIICSVSGTATRAEIAAVSEEVEKACRPSRHYNKKVPEKIKRNVGEYALVHGTKAAQVHFGRVYPHFTFLRTSVNNWKRKAKSSPLHKNKGRPNLLNDHLLQKVKDIINGTRAAGGVISRKMTIAIGNGVVKANDPSLLKQYGGPLELTEMWARGVLTSLNYSKRRGTTGKVEPSEQFLREEKSTFQRNIASAVQMHDIPEDLVINLDQTPLSYVSPGKYTFHPRGEQNVPIKGVDDKRQITGTFAVSLTGEFLPIQVIYQGKTKRCLPKHKFPKTFHITYTKNHWSNTEKSVEYFKHVIFPYLKKVKTEKGYPEEQMSLIIMDTFKGQDNETLSKLCADNHCVVVLVPNNLTNKFQPLDLTVNKPAKVFLSEKYNHWYADEVSKQLRRNINPADVKVSLKLTHIKVLHARWINDLYHHLIGRKDIIINGFSKAGITEAYRNAQEIVTRIENPFHSGEYINE